MKWVTLAHELGLIAHARDWLQFLSFWMHQNLFALHSCGNKIECVHDEKKTVYFDPFDGKYMHNAIDMHQLQSNAHCPIICSFVFSIFNCFYYPIFRIPFCLRWARKREKAILQFPELCPNDSKWEKNCGFSHSLYSMECKKTNHKLTFIYLFTIFNSIFTCHSRTCASHLLSGYHIDLFCASNIVFIINSFFPMQFDSQLESRLIYWHFRCTLTDIQRCFALFAAAVAASLRV